MAEQVEGRCTAEVSSTDSMWRSSPSQCKNKAKEDGLCGVHLRAKKQREEGDRRWSEVYAQSNANKAAAEAACKELFQLGIVAEPYFDYKSTQYQVSYTGAIVVRNVDELLRKLTR